MAYVTGHNYAETLDASDGVTNGNDTILGFDGVDILYGLGGDDTLIGGEGADTLNGGLGSDTAYYLQSTEAVVVSLATGRGYGGDAQGDRYIDIENVLGSEYNDLITGNAGDNRLIGDAGNDTLDGGAGNDALYGNTGNDTLKGGGGADDLFGDTGIDTVSYDGSSAGVFVSLYHNAAGGGDAEGDWFNSVENVTGSRHADDLWGDNEANTLNGLGGHDTLKGYGGADTLLGGDGNDHLSGMAGADMLTGGAGADTFHFDATTDTLFAAPDRITDFQENNGDRIHLSDIDANALADGNQAFTWIGNNNAFVRELGAGQLRFNGGYVEGDVNGDMVADFRIQVAAADLHDYAFHL